MKEMGGRKDGNMGKKGEEKKSKYERKMTEEKEGFFSLHLFFLEWSHR